MRTTFILSFFNSKWSRYGIILSLLMTLAITNSSCEKDCNCETEVPVSDEYYVKYEVISSTIYLGGKLDVTIKDENSSNTTFSINQGASWDLTIGPVQKGFLASLLAVASDTTYNKLKLSSSIYVSKNGSPFALKKSDGSDSPRDLVEINYTIDY